MIDDLVEAISLDADADSETLGHPSQMSRAEGGQKRRTGSRPLARPARDHASVTCSTCRITYLPSALPPPSATEVRVCDSCQQTLG